MTWLDRIIQGEGLMKQKPNSAHIPKWDDYELPAEFPLDRRKLKPNRFVGRSKRAHEGAHPGAGRKQSSHNDKVPDV